MKQNIYWQVGRRQEKFLTEKAKLYLRENYPNTSNKVLMQELGISNRTLQKKAKALGLKKSEQYLQQLADELPCKWQNAHKTMSQEKLTERKDKISATRKKLYQKERMRIGWGLSQKTKLKIGADDPLPKRRARVRLRKYGYEVEAGSNVAIITTATIRKPELEKRYSEKFRLRFQVKGEDVKRESYTIARGVQQTRSIFDFNV